MKYKYVLFSKQRTFLNKELYTLYYCWAHAPQTSLQVGEVTKFYSENFSASKVGQNRLGRKQRGNTVPTAGEGLRLTYGYGKARPQRMVTVTCSAYYTGVLTLYTTLHRTPSQQLWEHELFQDNYPCDTRRTAARALQGWWVEGGGCTKGLFVVVPSHPASFCPWLSPSPDKVICFCLTFPHLCVVAC